MRKIWFISIILFSCSGQPDSFRTFDPDPTLKSLRENKIKYFETFFINADTLVKLQTIKLDSSGQTIEKRTAKNILLNNRDYKYDSLGRMIKYIVDSDIFIDYTITYESYPKQQLLVAKWNDKDFGDTYLDYIKYNENLNQILRKTEIEVDSKDTLNDFTYQYDKDKLINIKNNRRLAIEYFYNQADKLKEIRNLNDSTVDYVSQTTGLIDSTTRYDFGKKIVTYYRYFK